MSINMNPAIERKWRSDNIEVVLYPKIAKDLKQIGQRLRRLYVSWKFNVHNFRN